MINVRHWLIHSLIALSLLVNMIAGFLLTAPAAQAQDITAAGDENWDNRFGLPGVSSGIVASIAVAANGNIFVAGSFAEAGNMEAAQVARWDGSQFHPLGEGLSGGSVSDIVTIGNDLYAVGNFTSAGFETVNGIARWDGTAWSVVGDGGGATDRWGSQGWLRAAAVYNGKLVIGGQFVAVDDVPALNIAMWDGNNWTPLGGGLHGPATWSSPEVHSLLAVGNTLYAGGRFEMADGVWLPPVDEYSDPELDYATQMDSIAQWNGTQWSPVGGGVHFVDGSTEPGTVMALAYGNDTLYAGGYFNRAGGKNVNFVAQFSGGAWSALGSGLKNEDFSTESPVVAMVFDNDQLYVGGHFVAAGGENIDLLAAWNGTTWNEVAGGINNEGFDKVHSLAIAPSGLVAGGLFRVMNDKMVNNVALLANGEWTALGQGVSTDYSDMPGKPYALASDDAGNIYIGGEFTRLGGVPAKNIGMWDGTRWHNLGDADSYIKALAIGDGFLFAGGNFTQIGGISASRVAMMNLQTGKWSALGSGINGEVSALVYSDGILYAGGAFKSAGNVTAEDVAWWDGAWHPFEGDYRIFDVRDTIGGEVDTYVNALAVEGDDVYIGGHFESIQLGTDAEDLSSFVVVNNVVGWNKATKEWSWVGTGADPGVTTDNFSGYGTDVYALATVGDSLFVGGAFNQAGGMAATGLARWDRAEEQWISIEGSLGGSGFDDIHVRGLAPAGADLLVAGKFTSAGATAARYIARFDTTTNQWSALGSGLRWYNDMYTTASAVLANAGGVYVGGEFDRAGEKGSLGFARWADALGAPNLTPEQEEQGEPVQPEEGDKATFQPPPWGKIVLPRSPAPNSLTPPCPTAGPRAKECRAQSQR